MIKYKILLIYYKLVIYPILFVLGTSTQIWAYYHKIYTLEKMQKLTPLEKELM